MENCLVAEAVPPQARLARLAILRSKLGDTRTDRAAERLPAGRSCTASNAHIARGHSDEH
jgi:hypothetical protein